LAILANHSKGRSSELQHRLDVLLRSSTETLRIASIPPSSSLRTAEERHRPPGFHQAKRPANHGPLQTGSPSIAQRPATEKSSTTPPGRTPWPLLLTHERACIVSEVSEPFELQPAGLFLLELHPQEVRPASNCCAHLANASSRHIRSSGSSLARATGSRHRQQVRRPPALYRQARNPLSSRVVFPLRPWVAWLSASSALLKPGELIKRVSCTSSCITSGWTRRYRHISSVKATKEVRFWSTSADNDQSPPYFLPVQAWRSQDDPRIPQDSHCYLQCAVLSGFDILFSTGKITEGGLLGACPLHSTPRKVIQPARVRISVGLVREPTR